MNSNVRLEVFVVMKTEVTVFWVTTPYSGVTEYQHSGGPRCLHLQDEVNRARKWT
jgi:hypothetical protein